MSFKYVVIALFLGFWLIVWLFPKPFHKQIDTDGSSHSQAAGLTPQERGLNNLLNKAYGRPLIDEKTFYSLWTVWDAEWKAKVTNPEDKALIRRLTLERYGFTESVDANISVPLQFVGTEKGLVYNCASCHGGQLPGTGKPKLGMPNTEVDMATFSEDVAKFFGRETKADHLQLTRGRTNAFKLSHSFFRYVNEDMSLRQTPLDLGKFQDGDLDAPPWWVLKKKRYLYSDGFVEGGFSRAIMQFSLLGTDDRDKFRGWEADFNDILAYLLTIEPPKYPYQIDAKLAKKGEKVFLENCAKCHGTYGAGGQYPNKIVPIDVVGTDATRLNGMSPDFRSHYAKSWIGQKSKVNQNPAGYIAPPLDGVWASAPYFHNGSVPTVYGVLTNESRPKYFRRLGIKEYDQQNLGVKTENLKSPASPNFSPSERRRVIDTTLPGLGNQGHPFGFHLTEKEKRQVIEYLKTL